ncbi:MAG TPA: hypothetical protein VK843_00955 [Planctomycetota bacterium]|nr:hypothetical protein [Planctomycetota bacterium]
MDATHNHRHQRLPRALRWLAIVLPAILLIAACVAGGPDFTKQHLWWSGLGPVLPHDTFPADCSTCHVGTDWQTLVPDFQFDHEAKTGVPLVGAHARASCLLCHNDRGPAAVYERLGCGGCHEDVHAGQLGPTCTKCHQEFTWEPVGMIELHRTTRFPLVGVHASTACHRCHPGIETGKILPADPECLTCHQRDLARTQNPNHFGLGWVDRCDRCHLPRTWHQAEINN